jgi:hypothetical protein
MKGKVLPILGLAVLASGMALVACGVGDTVGLFTPVQGGGGTSGTSNLFFLDNGFAGMTTALFMVDPSSPGSTPVRVDSSLETSSVNSVETGAYDPVNLRLTGVHQHSIVYAKGGRIYRVSAEVGGNRTPVQVSGETGATALCGTGVYADYADPSDSFYLYKLPGPTPGCFDGDEVRRAVRLGDSSSVAPVTITGKQVVDTLMNMATGAIQGWLVEEGNLLRRCDVSFSSCVTVQSFSARVIVLGTFPSGTMALILDNDVRLYNPSTGSLSASVYTLQHVTQLFNFVETAAAGGFIYFTDGGNVLRLSGTGAVTILSADTDPDVSIESLSLTTNKVVFKKGTFGTQNPEVGLYAVPKTGGNALYLDNLSLYPYDVIYTGGNNIYYNKGVDQFLSPTVSAYRVTEDNAARVVFDNAVWLGQTLSDSVTLNPGAEGSVFVDRLILVERNPSATDFENAVVRSVVAATFGTPLTLGTLQKDPAAGDQGVLYFNSPLSFGTKALGLGILQNSNSLFQADLFFLDAATGNSLLRITRTPDLFEEPVWPGSQSME